MASPAIISDISSQIVKQIQPALDASALEVTSALAMLQDSGVRRSQAAMRGWDGLTAEQYINEYLMRIEQEVRDTRADVNVVDERVYRLQRTITKRTDGQEHGVSDAVVVADGTDGQDAAVTAAEGDKPVTSGTMRSTATSIARRSQEEQSLSKQEGGVIKAIERLRENNNRNMDIHKRLAKRAEKNQQKERSKIITFLGATFIGLLLYAARDMVADIFNRVLPNAIGKVFKSDTAKGAEQWLRDNWPNLMAKVDWVIDKVKVLNENYKKFNASMYGVKRGMGVNMTPEEAVQGMWSEDDKANIDALINKDGGEWTDDESKAWWGVVDNERAQMMGLKGAARRSMGRSLYGYEQAVKGNPALGVYGKLARYYFPDDEAKQWEFIQGVAATPWTVNGVELQQNPFDFYDKTIVDRAGSGALGRVTEADEALRRGQYLKATEEAARQQAATYVKQQGIAEPTLLGSPYANQLRQMGEGMAAINAANAGAEGGTSVIDNSSHTTIMQLQMNNTQRLGGITSN